MNHHYRLKLKEKSTMSYRYFRDAVILLFFGACLIPIQNLNAATDPPPIHVNVAENRKAGVGFGFLPGNDHDLKVVLQAPTPAEESVGWKISSSNISYSGTYMVDNQEITTPATTHSYRMYGFTEADQDHTALFSGTLSLGTGTGTDVPTFELAVVQVNIDAGIDPMDETYEDQGSSGTVGLFIVKDSIQAVTINVNSAEPGVLKITSDNSIISEADNPEAGDLSSEITFTENDLPFTDGVATKTIYIKQTDDSFAGNIEATFIPTKNPGNDNTTIDKLVLRTDEPNDDGIVMVLNTYESSGFIVFDASESYATSGAPLTLSWNVAGNVITEGLDGSPSPEFIDLRIEDELPLIRLKYGNSVPVIVRATDGVGTSSETETLGFYEPETVDTESFSDMGDQSDIPDYVTSGWEKWYFASDDLDISRVSRIHNLAKVKKAFGAMTSKHPIPPSLPKLSYNQQKPTYVTVKADRSVRVKPSSTVLPDEGKHIPHATPAMVARLNIRVNMQYLKQNIVNEVYKLLKDHPPVLSIPIVLNNEKREDIANRMADIYIKAVDKFLGIHFGAVPAQGSRGGWQHKFGLQDKFNHPWCVDWADFIEDEISAGISSENIDVVSPTIRSIFDFRTAQKRKDSSSQHNWNLIYPRGTIPVTLVSFPTAPVAPSKLTTNVKDKVLHIDPWINLLPYTYREADHPIRIDHIGIGEDTAQ